jgi:hypothetical protein
MTSSIEHDQQLIWGNSFMNSTLILYDRLLTNSDPFLLIQKILGPSKPQSINDFQGDFKGCSSVAILITAQNDTINFETRKLFENYTPQLKSTKVAIVCISNNTPCVQSFLSAISFHLGECVAFSDNIDYPEKTSKKEMAIKLVSLKRNLIDPSDMPKDILTEHINHILLAHNTCTLCTGFGNELRATPIEYTYAYGALYFLSEGGEKFANLFINPKVCISIYQEYSSFNALEGVQISGIAEMIELFSEEYIDIITKRGLSITNLKVMPVKLNMFKVIPERIQVLQSKFKTQGYHAKQLFAI